MTKVILLFLSAISLLPLVLKAQDKENTVIYYLPETMGQESPSVLSLAQKERLVRLFNMSSGAIFDGLLRNGALTGLGTNIRTGKSLLTDNFYFQALRIYTIFDKEFQIQFAHHRNGGLPPYIALAFGDASEDFLSRFPVESSKDWQKVHSAIKLFAGKDFNFTLRHSKNPLFTISPDSQRGSIQINKDLNEGLMLGYLDKYNRIQEGALDTREADAQRKLESLMAALSPLGGYFEADYQAPINYMRISGFIPGLYSLDTEDELNPLTWSLRPGLDKQALRPKELDISIARITDLSYLRYDKQHLESFQKPMIKIDVFKDLDIENTVFLSSSFGRMIKEGDALEFSDDNPADGFVIHWQPNIPKNFMTRGIAEELNQIRVEASIQRLNLLLSRQENEKGDHFNNPKLLKPKYVSKTLLDRSYPDLADQIPGSKIHFRAKRSFAHTHRVGPVAAKTFYQTLGFACLENGDRVDCTQTMSTFDRKDEDVLQQFKNFVSKYFTRFLVGIFIPDIEEALDEHVSELLEEALEHVADGQEDLLEKVRTELFKFHLSKKKNESHSRN